MCRGSSNNSAGEDKECAIPTKAQRLAEEVINKEMEGLETHFSNLLTTLPDQVSKQTAGDLSVAIGLNCLLHLANEKVSLDIC